MAIIIAKKAPLTEINTFVIQADVPRVNNRSSARSRPSIEYSEQSYHEESAVSNIPSYSNYEETTHNDTTSDYGKTGILIDNTWYCYLKHVFLKT